MLEYTNLCEHAKEQFGIDIRKDRSRRGATVRVRHSIATLLSTKYGYSVTEVGNTMRFDHTTVVHCRMMHVPRYQTDKQYAKVYDTLDRLEPTDQSLQEIINFIKNIP